MNYTKGEWRCFKMPGGWQVERVNGEQIAFSIHNEANANLIAVAPNMYSFLKDLQRAIEKSQERIGASREAILDWLLAKAEGRE